jgi:WD40 repeat protein
MSVQSRSPGGASTYDAFISYNRGADAGLAKAMHSGLQKLSKPWNRRRALNVFLDQSSLELSSELGREIEERLEDTEWLVLLLSEQAAASKWVGKEIQTWAAAKSKDRIALVLTGGTLTWNQEAKDFDYAQSTAINDSLRNVYTGQDTEPLYLDLSWTETFPGGEGTLSLDNPRFRDAMATLSATIQGKSKDEVEGEDLRQHRRFVRLRRVAVGALCALTIAAVAAGVVARSQRSEAVEQRGVAELQAQRSESRATASDALVNVETEPDLAALLALESGRLADTVDARGALAQVLSLPTRFLERIDAHDAPVTSITFSESGRLAASADEVGVVRIWHVDDDPVPLPQATVGLASINVGVPIRQVTVSDDGLVVAFTRDGRAATSDLALCRATDCPFDIIGAIVAYPFDDEFQFGERVVLDLEDAGEVSEVSEIGMSLDGSRIGIGSGTNVAIWSWRDGSLWTAKFAAEVSSIAFSPDNDPVASPVVVVGDESGMITLYSLADDELTAVVADPTASSVTGIVFRPEILDGVFQMASTHTDGEVILWGVVAEDGGPPIGYRIDSMQGHNDEALAIGFSPTGRIASGDFLGETIWWLDTPVAPLGNSVVNSNFDGGGNAIGLWDVAFVDGDIVVADDLGALWLADPTSSRSVEIRDGVNAVDAGNGVIAAGLDDGTVVLIDKSGRELERLGEPGLERVEYIAMSSTGDRVVTARVDEEFEENSAEVFDGVVAGSSSVVVWGLVDSSAQELDVPDGFEVESLLVSDRLVLVGGQTSADLPAVFVYDAVTGLQLGVIEHSDRRGNGVGALAVSSDGETIAVGGGDRRISLWDATTLERQSSNEFRGHRGDLSGIVFWSNDTILISADHEGAVLMWDVAEQRQFASLGGPTRKVASLDLEGGYLIASSEDGAVWGWSLDIDEWRRGACDLAGRNMTAREWGLYGDGPERVRHCVKFPTEAGPVVDAVYPDAQRDSV